MSNAYVIETRSDRAAGIAVREERGYRFFASEARFYPLESRRFRHLRAVHAAVEAADAIDTAKSVRRAA
jgi:hypothetical protein